MLRKIFKGSINLAATVTMQLVSFVVGIYCAKTLDLGEFGALSLIGTIFLYATFSTVGITEAIRYRLPILRAKNDVSQIEFTQRFLFTVTLANFGFVIIFGLCSLYGLALNGIVLTTEWLLVGLILFLSSVSYCSTVLYLSHQNFFDLAIFRLIYPTAFLTLILLLLPSYQLTGYLMAMFAAYLLAWIYSLRFIMNKIGYAWDYRRAKEYVKIGLPIKLGDVVWSLFVSIDLWIVSLFIGASQAGLYAMAMLVCKSFHVIPFLLGEFVQPKISWYYGRVKGQKQLLTKPYEEILLSFLLSGISGSVLTLVFFHFIVSFYLTKYAPVLILTPILLSGYLVQNIRNVTRHFLILLAEQGKMLIIDISSLILVVIFGLTAALCFKSLWLVAASTAIGLCFNGIAFFALLIRKLTIKPSPSFIVRIFAIITLGIISVIITYMMLGGIQKDIVISHLGLLFVLMIGLFVFAFLRFLKFWRLTGIFDDDCLGTLYAQQD